MAEKMTVVDEIIAATKIEAKKKKEATQNFFGRLVKAASKLEDEKWKELTDETQEWVSTQAKALNEKETLVSPPGYESEATVAALSTEGGADAKAEASSETPVKKKGATVRLRELVCENPDAKLADVFKQVIDEGFKLAQSTAEVVFYETKSTIKTLKALGKLRE